MISSDALEEMLRERALLRQDSILAKDISQRTSFKLKALRRGVSSLGLGMKAAALWKGARPSNPLPDASD